jgi:hypothetical protein
MRLKGQTMLVLAWNIRRMTFKKQEAWVCIGFEG